MPTAFETMDSATQERVLVHLRMARASLEAVYDAVRAALLEAGIEPDEPDDDEAA
jgi:hypothetical protein